LGQKHLIRDWVLNNKKVVSNDVEEEDGHLDQFIQDIPKLVSPLAWIGLSQEIRLENL